MQDNAVDIGQQHRESRSGELLIEVGHFHLGGSKQLCHPLLASEQLRRIDHHHFSSACRIESVVAHAADPGLPDPVVARHQTAEGIGLHHRVNVVDVLGYGYRHLSLPTGKG